MRGRFFCENGATVSVAAFLHYVGGLRDAQEERPMSSQQTQPTKDERKRFGIPLWLGACLFLTMAVFLLWEGHRAHLLGSWPLLLFLLTCPIIHLSMHRRHGHSGHHSRSNPDGDEK